MSFSFYFLKENSTSEILFILREEHFLESRQRRDRFQVCSLQMKSETLVGCRANGIAIRARDLPIRRGQPQRLQGKDREKPTDGCPRMSPDGKTISIILGHPILLVGSLILSFLSFYRSSTHLGAVSTSLWL